MPVLILLAVIFFCPILFGIKLLGTSWLLALFVTTAFYPAMFLLAMLVAGGLDLWSHWRGRRRAARRRAERNLPMKPMKGKGPR